MPEKYTRLVQEMYQLGMQNSSAQCGRGEQQLWGNLILLLMDVLTEDVRKDVPGSMMFADNIVLCGDDETE